MAFDDSGGGYWWLRWRPDVFLRGAPAGGARDKKIEAFDEVVSQNKQVRFKAQYGGGLVVAVRRRPKDYDSLGMRDRGDAGKEIQFA